jgi:DNA-directed RNA polymerase specialized sigma24 family protein
MSGDNQRLSRIKTRWTMVAQAHQGQGDEAMAAQRRLLLSYYKAVYRYLCGMVRDPDVAEELTHEFSVRFLRGDFKRAAPAQGRFRDLIKIAARNLAVDYWRRQALRKKKGPHPLPKGDAPPDRGAGGLPLTRPETEAIFLREWRQALLGRAWKMLARLQQQSGSYYFTLLRYKVKHPEVGAAELAQKLGARLRRPCTEASIRQTLRRARQKFADYIVAEVSRSLRAPTPEAIGEELRELSLLRYCKAALQRYRKRQRR